MNIGPIQLLLILIIITVYLFPTVVVFMRNGRNKLSIFLLNLLLGWTFIGWVVALVLAARARS